MKQGVWMYIPLGLVLAAGAHGQEIRKCVDHGVVGYQNAPCSAGQVDAGLVKLPDYADPPTRDPATAPAQNAIGAGDDAAASASTPAAPQQGAFPFRTSITLGMTDDQVLNIPNWGRPTHIERMGRHRDWRETWTYARPGEVRTLSFVQGRLANISAETSATRLASIDNSQRTEK